MSSLFASGQTARKRLFLLASGHARPSQYYNSLAPALTIVNHTTGDARRRQYATKISPVPPPPNPSSPPLPSTTPSSRLSARGAEKEPPRWIFSPADVPLLPEWKHGLETLGNTDLDPMQCMQAAQRYVSAATQHESYWRPRLEKDHGLTPYLLHWLGIVLMSGNTPARWKLGTHMLRSASELGHDPSTLTLVRILNSMSGGSAGKAAKSRVFAEASQRFQQVLQRTGAAADPDAHTLQGLVLLRSGGRDRNRRALESFRRAEKAWEARAGAGADAAAAAAAATTDVAAPSPSNDVHPDNGDEVSLPPPRAPRWEWEVSNVLEQAGILEKQQQQGRGASEAAVALYRVAALELDNPTAFWKLAQLMGGPRDSPERRTYLLKAAISGVTEACRELGELEGMAAGREGLSRAEREDHEKMSREWLRLADGDEVKSIQNEAMSDVDN